MKAEIHPNYHADAKIICACGNIMQTGSTMPEIHVELCSKCHPFFTGKQKLIDTARRVEKFGERASKKSDAATGKKVKTLKRATAKAEKKAKKQPTQLAEV